MPLHLGPGPVFVHESITATRRWQLYLVRSLFVFGLLVGLSLAWIASDLSHQRHDNGQSMSIKELASLGQSFYLAIATVQLALVLLIAPAATAGSICLDRARGTLTHMLVTDLASSEIVLGKLAARLLPVFALVASTMPVLALAGLLGGVVIEAIITLTVLTVCLAILGCSLALAFSVRATRTHEVLMAVYGIEAVWVLGPAVWMILASSGLIVTCPYWFMMLNPFVLAWAPYAWPEQVSVSLLAGVVAGTMTMSALLVAYAVLRVRAETRSGPSRQFARAAVMSGQRMGTNVRLAAGTLAGSRTGLVAGMAARAAVASGQDCLGRLHHACSRRHRLGRFHDDRECRPRFLIEPGPQFLGLVGGLEATFGLLLLSMAAPTVLAEERVRGSLDVLLTTPIATDRIVLAKWWGAFRVVPALALLPAIGAIVNAATDPARAFRMGPTVHPPAPLETIDRLAIAGLPVLLFLAQGAAVTSLGLLLATWVRRLGRAVAASVTLYAVFALGWLILLEIGVELVTLFGNAFGLFPANDRGAEEFFTTILASACPLGGQFMPSVLTELPGDESRGAYYIGLIVAALATFLVSLVMLALSLLSFDRCIGRVPERPRRAPKPPRRFAAITRPHGRGEVESNTVEIVATA